jgi:hypothetical protein
MIRAFEFVFMLLQLGPILTLTIGSNPLSPQLAPRSRQVRTEGPESTTVSS